MTYNDFTLPNILLTRISTLLKKRIYTCTAVPYYEEFPIHPEYLLKDLIWIFHPS